MKNTKMKLITMLLLSLGFIRLNAQEAIPATGGEASGSGGTVSYTVGQVACITNTTNNITITQGVQQPYVISVVEGIDKTNDIELIYSAYPNPVTDFLILKIEGDIQNQYIANLYDISGKLIENIKIEGNETTISMKNLIPSTYFLKVIQAKDVSSPKEIKTFKIIKK